MTNDIEALDSLVTDSVVTLFQSGLTLLGTIVILIILDPTLALITFGIFPFVIAGSIWFRLVSAGAFRRTRETIGSITAGTWTADAFSIEPTASHALGDAHETPDIELALSPVAPGTF